MNIGVFLLVLSLVGLSGGGALAVNVRGVSHALARRGEANAELRRHSLGDLGEPSRTASAGLFRFLGTVVALASVVLLLGALVVLAG
ncbi:hypothetical protein ACIPJK_37105 [Streptomyces roseus]|uniref:hypothetical protein n=1 Tax=Streptomyces roseus TaxID=66430 RepID=UPI0038134683